MVILIKIKYVFAIVLFLASVSMLIASSALASIALQTGSPTSGVAVGNPSITISYASGHASGDVAYVLIVSGSARTVTGGKTWTTIATTAAAGGFEGYLLRRVLDGTEGATDSLTVTTASNILGYVMFEYKGVKNATPEDGSAQVAIGGSSTTPSATGFSTSIDGDQLLFLTVGYNANPTSYTTPTGFGNATTVFSVGSSMGTAGWDKAQGTHGATGGVSSTQGVSSNWATALIAIQPAAAVSSQKGVVIVPE